MELDSLASVNPKLLGQEYVPRLDVIPSVTVRFNQALVDDNLRTRTDLGVLDDYIPHPFSNTLLIFVKKRQTKAKDARGVVFPHVNSVRNGVSSLKVTQLHADDLARANPDLCPERFKLVRIWRKVYTHLAQTIAINSPVALYYQPLVLEQIGVHERVRGNLGLGNEVLLVLYQNLLDNFGEVRGMLLQTKKITLAHRMNLDGILC